MIVRLTTSQLDAVRRAFNERGMDWVDEAWLERAKLLPGHATTHEVVMPAVGWERAMWLLVDLTVGPLGGNKSALRGAAINARNRIAAALAHENAHPALYGVGMIGTFFDVIPVWVTGAVKPRRLYEITPSNGCDFAHLLPERDGEFTVWNCQQVLSTGLDGSLLDEATHLRFTNAPRAVGDGRA